MADHLQINDITPRIRYLADGVQTAFTYPFPIFAAADLEVHLDAERQTAGYAVDGVGQDAGGSVTFDAAPAAGVAVTLTRRLAIARTTDFQDAGEFRAKVLNDELDRVVAIAQQLKADIDRTVRLAETAPAAADLSLPPPEASRLLAWNAAADGFENRAFAEVPASAPWAAATPQPPTTDGGTGVADELARADHAHPLPAVAAGLTRGDDRLAPDLASQAEAEGGLAEAKLMTPLRTAQAIAALAAATLPADVQVFTASATYTRSAGVSRALVIAVGGGGGGGGVGTASGTGRGGSGGPGETRIAVVSPGASETVTIGAGGSGGATGDNPGGDGGDTSFGSHLTAGGGVGGGGSTGDGNGFSGDTNVGSGGAIIPPTQTASTGNSNMHGGSTLFGIGAAVQVNIALVNGQAGTNPGTGGHGAGAAGGLDPGTTPRAGASGNGGLVLVIEFGT